MSHIARPNGRGLSRWPSYWNYRGDYYVNADNLHNPYIPGRTIGNVRAAYSPRNDRWELAVWARNVTDKH